MSELHIAYPTFDPSEEAQHEWDEAVKRSRNPTAEESQAREELYGAIRQMQDDLLRRRVFHINAFMAEHTDLAETHSICFYPTREDDGASIDEYALIPIGVDNSGPWADLPAEWPKGRYEVRYSR